MRALLVGGTGFVGRHLARTLKEDGVEVACSCQSAPAELDPYAPGEVETVDVTDRAATASWIRRRQPDRVFHLAAVSDVPGATREPARAVQVNVLGVTHVLEAVAHERPHARVLVVSSGLVYEGADPRLCPWKETTPMAPLSLYAATKAAAEEIARAFQCERRMPIVIARPFNQTGPGQSPRFVVSCFCREAAQIALGLAPPIICAGNLEARRDFCDVRDFARALVLAIERGAPGATYNLSSGVSTRIGDLLESILRIAGIDPAIERSPDRLRPEDAPVSAGDATRALLELGWQPEIPIDRSLADAYADWKSRLARGDRGP